MREIKFRAWDTETKQWLSNHSNAELVARTMSGKCDRFLLMQSTGLKDCKGNEIYEHDFLKHWDDGRVFLVEWDSDAGEWSGYGAFREWSECEVVGNIYGESRAFGVVGA